MGRRAVRASRELAARMSGTDKDAALLAGRRSPRGPQLPGSSTPTAADVEEAARRGASPTELDRLRLTEQRVWHDGDGPPDDRGARGPCRAGRRRQRAPERSSGPTGARAARRRGRHIREPPQRDERLGRALPEGGQRDDAPRFVVRTSVEQGCGLVLARRRLEDGTSRTTQWCSSSRPTTSRQLASCASRAFSTASSREAGHR